MPYVAFCEEKWVFLTVKTCDIFHLLGFQLSHTWDFLWAHILNLGSHHVRNLDYLDLFGMGSLIAHDSLFLEETHRGLFYQDYTHFLYHHHP